MMIKSKVPVRCPTCLQGVLFDVTPRVAHAMGQKHVRCDLCRKTFVYKISGARDDRP